MAELLLPDPVDDVADACGGRGGASASSRGVSTRGWAAAAPGPLGSVRTRASCAPWPGLPAATPRPRPRAGPAAPAAPAPLAPPRAGRPAPPAPEPAACGWSGAPHRPGPRRTRPGFSLAR